MLEIHRGVDSLANEVIRLRNDQKVRGMVDDRIADFLEVNKTDTYKWFEELTYCILTAYSSARMGQICVDALCDCGALIDGSLEEVVESLRCQGHRFALRRAEYIVEARRHAQTLKKTVESFGSSREARRWLVENVKGLGWKEASHFLRNVGYLDVAIIDRHIISNMREHGLIEADGRKGLTRRRYLEYERLLKAVAARVGMTLGEMDLYLWYRKTGKVLK
ncbi:MAG: N-glycosylase/DNA lyase [Candidatus Bathyarchaeota archaeon]|nr:MAG: N-glycosylase/DNA lyase [Candidatus Bathyarchaeota archaeon]